MAYKVNIIAHGTTLASPTQISSGHEILWSSNAGRSPDTGKMIGDIVARKKTFDITWEWLTRAQFATLRDAVNAAAYFNLKIQFIHGGETDNDADITVYHGGIEKEFAGYFGSTFYYKSVKISFVQQ